MSAQRSVAIYHRSCRPKRPTTSKTSVREPPCRDIILMTEAALGEAHCGTSAGRHRAQRTVVPARHVDS
jgi:hypothetical protein